MRSRSPWSLLPVGLVGFVAAVGITFFADGPGGAVAASSQTTTPTTIAVNTSSSNIASGRTLFIENCSSCHGTNAEGSARAPSLLGLGAATIDFWVSTGRMPLAYPTAQAAEKPPLFDAKQTQAIVAYVTHLHPGGPGIPYVDVAAGDVSEGQILFSLNCAGCHTITGAGDALASGYYAPSLYPATATQIAEAMRTGPGNMPRFSPTQLTPAQLTDIVAYVHKYIQHPVDIGGLGLGAVGPVAEGFVALAIGVGLLMALAYWIGDRAVGPDAAPPKGDEGHGVTGAAGHAGH